MKSEFRASTKFESTSKFGLSVVTVLFQRRHRLLLARQQVFERLSDAKDHIPAGFEPTMDHHHRTGQIYLYQIVGRGKSVQELRTLQDWVVKLQLRTVPGVRRRGLTLAATLSSTR